MTWSPELVESYKRFRAAFEKAERELDSLSTPEEREQFRQRVKKYPMRKEFSSGHVLILGQRKPLIIYPWEPVYAGEKDDPAADRKECE